MTALWSSGGREAPIQGVVMIGARITVQGFEGPHVVQVHQSSLLTQLLWLRGLKAAHL
jgi:hypothetical protein